MCFHCPEFLWFPHLPLSLKADQPLTASMYGWPCKHDPAALSHAERGEKRLSWPTLWSLSGQIQQQWCDHLRWSSSLWSSWVIFPPSLLLLPPIPWSLTQLYSYNAYLVFNIYCIGLLNWFSSLYLPNLLLSCCAPFNKDTMGGNPISLCLHMCAFVWE